MRVARGPIARAGPMLVCSVDPDPSLAADDSQQSAVVHVIEQVRRRTGGAAPVVSDRAMGEVLVHLAGVHRPTVADEIQQGRARVSRALPSTASDRCVGASAPARRRSRTRS